MAVLASLFARKERRVPTPASDRLAVRAMLRDCSIEVMPRTAAKVEDFKAILAPRHPGLYRPYRRHAYRRDGGYREAPGRGRFPGHAAFSGAHHSRCCHPGRLDRPVSGRSRSGTGAFARGRRRQACRDADILHGPDGNRICSTRRVSSACMSPVIPRATGISTRTAPIPTSWRRCAGNRRSPSAPMPRWPSRRSSVSNRGR